ncbi:hypothetical protein QTG54_013022 [Skeletonema marinoi]|uniref:GYF domain-containing protein n=1 Tax=Skeletonema marinoi TaxID=267567 RepID=A0AAD9D757_9STRA|nr:hypothetical protein QTG54_013022 [Skeletonema marinoi]
MSSNSSSMPRLGPAWRSGGAGGSGRGFQPPPAVPDETRDRSGSHASGGTAGSGAEKNRNPFSLLDDEEDGGAPTTSNSSSGVDKNSRAGSSSSRGPPAPTNDRFSALKSSESSRPYNRSASSGPRPGGRSLADLAAGLSSTGGDRENHHHHRGPSERNDSKPIHRSASTGYHPRGERGGTSSDIQRTRSGSGGGASLDHDDGGAKIIRFTREKLLSLRPRHTGDVGLPDVLKHMEGTVVISSEPQDPVCWDTFDSDEIWSQVARERRTSERGPPPPKDEPRRGSRLSDDEPRAPRERRGTGFSTGGGGGRWQRGMSIPESDRGSRPSRNDVEADNPDDLWDDPTTGGGALAAAADFSAFGGSLEDDHPRGKTGMDAFELTDMSKAAAAFEAEMDVDKKDENGNDSEAEDNHNHTVDSSRPLAGSGTTIRSGSGNDVSVFEDFDEPSADVASEEAPIKGGNEANAASSRLMQMIGVSGTGEASSGAAAEVPKPESSANEKAEAIPSNPWGAPAVSSNPWGDAGGLGTFGSQPNETKGASAQQREEEERRRQQEEEKKRWEAMQAKQQADLQAQQQQQQQLRQQQQDQVENVLMERVSNILENSWGKSDLNSILSTLHAEDSRVIAILSSIDQMRALISRHPQRIQLGTEGGVIMAQLRLNNQQWQVAQAQIAQAKAVQEQQELQRRRLQEEQLRQQQAAQQQALARARALEQERQKQQVVKINPNAPWFYADPQGNIQGPFAGDEMKQWLEAGYFKGDLPISQNNGGPFRPLASYFSDPKTAFQSNQSGEDKAEVEARAQAEAEAAAKVQAAKEAEERRRAEEAAKLAEEERRGAAEAELQQQADQSAQLKMMLGLGGGSTGIAGPPQPEPEPAAVEQPTKKQQKKKAQQKQAQPQQTVEEKKVEKVAPAPEPAAPPAPAWGAGAAADCRKKSMSEIQQEEAKEAARRAKEQGGRPSGGGWANVAATGGSTAWGGAAATAPAAAVVSQMPVVAGVTSTQKINANAAWNMKQTAASSAPAAATNQAQKAAAVDNFGANGQMTSTMEKWCKDQMQKLNGSDDLTLVTFCMTLTDSDEIRQYLSAYLGSTPQVNNFATEFIKRKGGDNNAEWESAGGPKKGRKKKGGK